MSSFLHPKAIYDYIAKLQKKAYLMLIPPIVLVIAGNDPTGGAGITADIQTLAQLGCHAAPVISCVTVQNTHNVRAKNPLSGALIREQALTVLADMPIAACKIGLLGRVEIIEAVAEILQLYPDMPVILDPVLAAGGGNNLSTAEILVAIRELLVPRTYLLTPNSQEARTLTALDFDLAQAAETLLAMGCKHICITGTHENTEQVVNTLYSPNLAPQAWSWARLPHSYHGSGCTFASSAAAGIAKGLNLSDAVYNAQLYTWQSLQQGFVVSTGQTLPLRVFKT